ncbi:LysR substrate binding domain protein [compost metagenome]
MSKTTGKHLPFEFLLDGELQEVQIGGTVAVFGAEIYTASAIAGIGIIQVPRYRVANQIAEGLLRVILPGYPPPPMLVSVLYPHNRHMSPRVRVFVDWLGERFAEAQRTQSRA